jgi:hypothetical protein
MKMEETGFPLRHRKPRDSDLPGEEGRRDL